MMQLGFLIDLNKCTGCEACVLACTIENELPWGSSWRAVYSFNESKLPYVSSHHLSLACNHCQDPACLRGCPARAYSKNPETGVVHLEGRHCLGCRYCTWICPYGAPLFDRKTGVVEKCTFCEERVGRGLKPACVTCCPTGALDLTSLEPGKAWNDVPGLTSSALGPAVEVVPLRSVEARLPPSIPSGRREGRGTGGQDCDGQVSLRSEWTLWLFSLLASFLVAWLSTEILSGRDVSPVPFVGTGVLAMLVTFFHLGRKRRAFRAVFNLRTSWLSREILFFSLFLLLSTICLAIFRSGTGSEILRWGSVSAGLAALVSIDMVYVSLPSFRAIRWHSSMATLNALYFLALLSGAGFLALLAGGTKAGLYVLRKIASGPETSRFPAGLSWIRVIAGFMVPGLLWFVDFRLFYPLILLIAGLAEMIDRAEFYEEIDLVTPKKQMERDLRSVCRKLPAASIAALVGLAGRPCRRDRGRP